MAPRSRQLSGPETPLEFQALGKALATWKGFSPAGAFQAQLSPGSLFTAPQGNGGGEAPSPTGSHSWENLGQEVGGAGVGVGGAKEGCRVSSSATPLRKTVGWMEGAWASGAWSCRGQQGIAEGPGRVPLSSQG